MRVALLVRFNLHDFNWCVFMFSAFISSRFFCVIFALLRVQGVFLTVLFYRFAWMVYMKPVHASFAYIIPMLFIPQWDFILSVQEYLNWRMWMCILHVDLYSYTTKAVYCTPFWSHYCCSFIVHEENNDSKKVCMACFHSKMESNRCLPSNLKLHEE